jgi:hypothetical protein
MLLTFSTERMNYESLGRYTEAKEKAEKLALEVHSAMASVGRYVSSSGVSNLKQAREYDFSAIRSNLDKAEKAYAEMTASIAIANHEAPLCEREPIKLVKW